ncbi:MAG: RHS repeat protein [Fibrobacter sp.]|nr:RHS repeat protein [Fibrobacter sp.]
MKAIFHAVVVLLTTVIVAGYAAEPNYVKTTVVGIGTDDNGNQNSTDAVSITYTDGLGRTLQSKANSTMLKTSDEGEIPAGSKFLTTCNFYDAAGRPEITTKPFLTDGLNYTSGDFESINNSLQQQYSAYTDLGDNEYAYSKVKYYDDPLSQVSRSSVPGLNNRLGSDGETAQWNFGVGTDEKTISSLSFKGGFITSAMDRESLDAVYEYLLSHPDEFPSYTHLLSISRDAGGKYTQVLKAIDGSSVKTAVQNAKIESGVTKNYLVISESRYDILGNLLTEIPPSDNGTELKLINETTYRYNTLGQVIRKETPDGLIERYTYDDAGLLSETVYYYMLNGQETIYSRPGLKNVYDAFGRIKNIIQMYTDASPVVEYFYDNTEELVAKPDLAISINGLLPSLTNLKGRMAGVINYDTRDRNKQVIDLFGYDDDGNVVVKYKIVPGLPIQKTEFTYDIHGKKLTEKISAGKVVFEKIYKYDHLGRLIEIVPANDPQKSLVKYSFIDLGQLTEKKRNGNIVTKYSYTIKDQVNNFENEKEVDATTKVKLFSESLLFKTDGNIESSAMEYNGYGNTMSVTLNYSYDNLNRLVSSTSTNASTYNSTYSYDDAGRIKSKKEGSVTLPEYIYYSGTSRLKKAKESLSSYDYLYDKYGNLVVDMKKNMVIEYDWRNLPIRFYFYTMIPETVLPDSKGDYFIQENGVTYSSDIYSHMDEKANTSSNVRLLKTVSMLYDASGNRVLKVESDM